jgi:hypothetical protein
LVRVGVDQAYGGWNAPVDPDSGHFIFVPIPDGPLKLYAADQLRNYKEIEAPLGDFGLAHGVSDLRLPDALLRRSMHLDPDFEHLTYGDNGTRRGLGIATLTSGDMLVFYAGLSSITPPNRLIYALIGSFVIDEVVKAVDALPERRHENAHTRWDTVSENDIVVRGKPGSSGRFDRCIPIGEWRDNAYRVRREVEDAWGGLTVKNGYIQRSVVPPQFKDAARFASWLQKQDVTLLQRNN